MAIEQVNPGTVSTFRQTINGNFGQVVLSNSPVFTGTPIAPSADISSNTNQIATMKATYLANARCMYGTCSSGAAVTEKVVVCPNFNLQAGNRIAVNFSYANSAINVTLNVNGTGAKSVMYHDSGITSDRQTVIPYVSELAYFIYNGTSFLLENPLDIMSNYTLLLSGWSSGVLIYSNNAIFSDSKITLTPAANITAEQLTALQEANIISTAKVNGAITLKAMGTVPTINIPVIFTISAKKGGFINGCGGGSGGKSGGGHYVGTTAPTDTSLLWIDTNQPYTNGCLKFYNGNSWVPVVAVYG